MNRLSLVDPSTAQAKVKTLLDAVHTNFGFTPKYVSDAGPVVRTHDAPVA